MRATLYEAKTEKGGEKEKTYIFVYLTRERRGRRNPLVNQGNARDQNRGDSLHDGKNLMNTFKPDIRDISAGNDR